MTDIWTIDKIFWTCCFLMSKLRPCIHHVEDMSAIFHLLYHKLHRHPTLLDTNLRTKIGLDLRSPQKFLEKNNKSIFKFPTDNWCDTYSWISPWQLTLSAVMTWNTVAISWSDLYFVYVTNIYLQLDDVYKRGKHFQSTAAQHESLFHPWSRLWIRNRAMKALQSDLRIPWMHYGAWFLSSW